MSFILRCLHCWPNLTMLPTAAGLTSSLQPPAPSPTTATLSNPLCALSTLSQGYGSLLMAEAERIARWEHRSTKIAVISGVGTRHYYRKLGYELEGPYMVKYLLPGTVIAASGCATVATAKPAVPSVSIGAVSQNAVGAVSCGIQPVSRRRRTVARSRLAAA